MKKQFYILFIIFSILIARDNNLVEQRAVIDERTVHRTGDYGLICQNENGTLNMAVLG